MLFEPFQLRATHLSNRCVMAPMTRSRAVDANTPNALMAEYYAQRASAGLIVTEGVSPSPNGLGYPRIPGLCICNRAQALVQGWDLVTDASGIQARSAWASAFRRRVCSMRTAHLRMSMPGTSRWRGSCRPWA